MNWRTLVAVMALTVVSGGLAAQVLDKDVVLQRQTWWDNRDWNWYESHIPFFESPDTAIDATYYYRWELITKHLTYGSPESGYTFTEFIDRPFWSGAYGAISCPLGHQFAEVRWLKDRRIIDDFARYWFETPGAQPRSYSNWYGHAMWQAYLVLGDTGFMRAALPRMEQQYAGWVAEHWDSAHAMFQWDGMHDGMEYNIDSRQTAAEFDGAPGYRPTLESYLYADEMAIARAARLLGDRAKANRFSNLAAALKQRVQQQLWDPARQFFFQQFGQDEQDGITAGSLTYQTGPHAGSSHGREEIGFVPWQFALPDSGYEAAWRYLMDPEYFFAPFGPTTTERNDPLFLVSPRCCYWSGNSWPYATSQTLEAFANLLNDYRQSVVTKEDYVRLLRVYTRTQRKGGRPYIAEAANPFTGSWDGHDTFYHSEHYFHSQYVNLIITGLAGLRPRADTLLEVNPLVPDDWDYFALDDILYHGYHVSIVWDRDGSHYGRGAGLSLFADGRRIGHAPRVQRLVVPLGTQRATPVPDRAVNLAVNNGRGAYPMITASYSAPTAPPFYLIDGNYWYHTSPPNRWTNQGSSSPRDWVTVDFGIERPVDRLALYFLDDGTGILPPASYEVERWTGSAWERVAGQRRTPREPTGHRANWVRFDRVRTSRIRVVLTNRPGAATGMTELEAWADIALPLVRPTAAPLDLAFNDGIAQFPRVSASFTSRFDKLEQVNDGRIAFTHYSRNRWTAYESPNASDWIAVDFGSAKQVGLIELYLWGDDRGVKAPKDYTVQYWDGGRWLDATVQRRMPGQPATWAVNAVRIAPVETQRIRVVFQHDLPAFTGVSELVVRGLP